ncbi:hypothetical protein KKC08_05985 [Patescibacteria group bacterium]|nr:hypothetical protein [Patescibacteria group bacterium]MBU4431186.1 hypothetical protein [Patescibacteria group bacterium]MCG2702054.1 hypothetical protein [Candidatus Parcubacteria bacterium]
MPNNLTTNQIQQLQSLGINTNTHKNPILPLLSISGITLLSFSGLIFFKNKNKTPYHSTTTKSNQNQIEPYAKGTPLESEGRASEQVPKSIQHYLLTSQQYFSQALEIQQSDPSNQTQTTTLLNQSILSATDAIKQFPNDYRSWQQRASIYQSLMDSQPQFLIQAISDLSKAFSLNQDSAQISKNLASLFAKKGDIQNTLKYLSQTILLEPTKAQNFYDLAKIQQQTGLLSQALNTYNQLLPLVTDPSQKLQINSEKTSLENLLSQNKTPSNPTPTTSNTPPSPTFKNLDSPVLQTSVSQNLVIAAPQDSKNINVNNLTNSNALSGEDTLPANQEKITINNSNITPTSQIYLTTTKGGKNQSLQILSKSKNSFTVGLNTSYNQDIEFKWWIIN